jgi:hypothetical protein
MSRRKAGTGNMREYIMHEIGMSAALNRKYMRVQHET